VTAASVVAAAGGTPLAGGASLRIASDVPADVSIELARDSSFRDSRLVTAGGTNEFHGAFADVRGLASGRRTYWRALLTRNGRTTVGPTRSFRVPPRPGSAQPVRIAIAACASQFGPIFDRLRDADPDVFVWQGDLNYPDTVGPLAQTMSGYAGIWRDFLANPVMAPLLERSLFAVQRDDHDYGVQDANSTNLVPWGLAPWEGLMERRGYYRFAAGRAEVWVLDERRDKSDPAAPDTEEKTLLGAQQRAWLLQSLAVSRAPFKIICSPCTLAPLSANQRDGSWATGFTAERDLLLRHIRDRVTGQTIFVTGDTHWTMVYDRDGIFEARPCPLGIPTPNDITLTQPNAAEDARRTPGVVYADDDKGHFALLEIARGHLDLALVREDGAVPFRQRLA
jgi:phosphodiesterase/alkaline phosphatase D-like protein